MIKKQAGQALILVLILLAIGALLVVPTLRLTSTALMGTPIVERQTKGLYAADAAQEYILWKLLYDGLGRQFTEDGQSADYDFNVCEVPVHVKIVMRAKEGKGGITLATDDTIKPTKTVAVEGHPEWSQPDGSVKVPNGYSGPYTYIIKLEQLSSDNSKGLDSLYDVLPKGLSYYANYGSWLRVDGGEWVSFPNPLTESPIGAGGQNRLRWPATLGTYFSSPMRHFDVRQVKEIKFQATGSLGNNTKFYNWVLLNVEEVDTLSGPICPIQTGDGSKQAGGLLQVSKSCDHEYIPPKVVTPLSYTISITNLETQTEQIYSITDYLPPDFNYTGPTSGLTTAAPVQTIETINGLERTKLFWNFPTGISMGGVDKPDHIKTLTFGAEATKDVSGTYYNEVIVVNKYPLSGDIYTPPDMSVGPEDFLGNYSWNTGAVVVPAYDTSSDSEGITINTNMALILGGITITSWQVY